MLSRLNIYVLVCLLRLKKPSVFLFFLPQLIRSRHFKFLTLAINNNPLTINAINNWFAQSKKKYFYLNPVDVAVRNAVFTNKPVYFLPCSDLEGDAHLINLLFNDFKVLSDIGGSIKKKIFNTPRILDFCVYSPSLVVYTDTVDNVLLVSNIKSLRVPSVGLVEYTVKTSPFDFTIKIPKFTPFFKIYYFMLIFKLTSYYKKVYINSLIFKYANLKLTYLKKLSFLNNTIYLDFEDILLYETDFNHLKNQRYWLQRRI